MNDIEALKLIDETCCDKEHRVYINLIKKNDELYNYLLNRYSDSESIKETIFRIKNNIEERPVCVMCGGKVKFDERVSHHHLRNHGYYWHCSSKCNQNNKETRDKIKNTCLEKYGDEHNWGKNSNVRYKCFETFKENHNTKEKLDELFEKRSKTKLEHYGDRNYNNREKFKETNLERYGVEYCFNTEKSRITKLQRYGTSGFNNPKKSLQTKLEKYGTISPGLEKAQETNLKRYGVRFFFQHPRCIEKSHSLEARLKAMHTCHKNGTNRKSKIETLIKDLILKKHPNLKIEENKRRYLDGYEIDIYLPDLLIGIEVQGDYFHANPLFYKEDDKILDKIAKNIWERDALKKEIAAKKGILLLQIWECDIKNNIDDVMEKISEQISARI